VMPIDSARVRVGAGREHDRQHAEDEGERGHHESVESTPAPPGPQQSKDLLWPRARGSRATSTMRDDENCVLRRGASPAVRARSGRRDCCRRRARLRSETGPTRDRGIARITETGANQRS
jgi:hypothetical protein